MNPSQRSSAIDSGALFRQVFEMRLTFLAVLDAAGIVLEVNRAPLDLGMSRDAFLGRHIGDTPSFASDPAWVATWDLRLSEAATAGTPIAYQDLFTGSQGEVRSADATLSPVVGSDGGVEYFVIEAEDTTDQLQAELALRDSERRFHDLAESIPALCWSADGAGACDYFNRRWLEYTGVGAGAHHGWAWTRVVHPGDRPQLAERWTSCLETGASLHLAVRLRAESGAHRWFDMRAEPVLDAEHRVIRWYATCADVHDAHELRRELDEREDQLGAALVAGSMARFAYDLEQRTFTADPYLRELIDVPRAIEASQGLEGFIEHIHPPDRAAWQQAMMRAFRPETPDFTLQYRLASPARGPQWIGSRGRVRFDDAGRPVSIVGVVFVLPDAGPLNATD